jgi:hypothetical protein
MVKRKFVLIAAFIKRKNTMCLRDEYDDWNNKKIEEFERNFLANEDYEKSLSGDDLIRLEIKKDFDCMATCFPRTREGAENWLYDLARHLSMELKDKLSFIEDSLSQVSNNCITFNIMENDDSRNFYVNTEKSGKWNEENWSEKLAELKAKLESDLADVNAKIEQEDKDFAVKSTAIEELLQLEFGDKYEPQSPQPQL